MIEVRRIHPDEWWRLRDVRLEALADAPMAFITTLEEADAYPEEVWRERAERAAAGDDQLTVLAVEGDRTLGMATGLRRSAVPRDVVPIVSVFVSPRARRCGVGRQMLAALEAWAGDGGATRTSLWVVEGNDEATRFYESLGYRRTTSMHVITVPPRRWERNFVKELTPAG